VLGNPGGIGVGIEISNDPNGGVGEIHEDVVAVQHTVHFVADEVSGEFFDDRRNVLIDRKLELVLDVEIEDTVVRRRYGTL
jgi:hypothetical protein